MRAAVLSVGSELLRGDIVDTNAAFLARELSELGFEVWRIQQVGDDLRDLSDAVSWLLAQADVTICTGGIGPTEDDLTRDAIAASLGQRMSEDPELLRQVEARFEAMGRRMPASNRRQALLIPSATTIPNPNGTAPGWYVTAHNRRIATLPGVPSEMIAMWRDWVRPRLESLLPGHASVRSLMVYGLGESAVEERIADVIHWRPEVRVATYAKTNGIEVHVSARAQSEAEASHLTQEAANRAQELLGHAVYGEAGDTLSSAVGAALRSRGLTLAVMESCTGGELSNLITDTDGSSEYFKGGMVAYTREAKALQGVDEGIMDQHGLISPETAVAMAAAARERLGADAGIGVTGIAGSEPVEGKAPGTVFIAVCLDGRQEVREIRRPGGRSVVKHFAAQSALDLLRRQLKS